MQRGFVASQSTGRCEDEVCAFVRLFGVRVLLCTVMRGREIPDDTIVLSGLDLSKKSMCEVLAR